MQNLLFSVNKIALWLPKQMDLFQELMKLSFFHKKNPEYLRKS